MRKPVDILVKARARCQAVNKKIYIGPSPDFIVGHVLFSADDESGSLLSRGCEKKGKGDMID